LKYAKNGLRRASDSLALPAFDFEL
jgi:hypothetical protein